MLSARANLHDILYVKLFFSLSIPNAQCPYHCSIILMTASFLTRFEMADTADDEQSKSDVINTKTTDVFTYNPADIESCSGSKAQ